MAKPTTALALSQTSPPARRHPDATELVTVDVDARSIDS